ncbi:hypothetical protein, partial [Granulicella sp. S190]|uniref:hypothetical protein n=1 Tax=Granulicella sp. S190 TaxID=1747226 RepID=UPI001C203FE1
MKRIVPLVATLALYGAVPLLLQAQSSTPATTLPASITEIPTPSPVSLPQGVDIAGDGSIWYAETSAGKIAVLHPNLSTAEFALPTGGQPV